MYKENELIDKVKSLNNYKFIPNGYWICGVRTKKQKPNTFNDWFYLFHNEKLIITTTGTTIAGTTILKNGFKKYNKKGAAILKSDEWYYNVWQYGLHKGYMPALKQLGAAVKVYRDNNNNLIAEEKGAYYKGYYGINFHTAGKNYLDRFIKKYINGWSAGCQVANNSIEYMKIIEHIKWSESGFFSYCLLNEFEV